MSAPAMVRGWQELGWVSIDDTVWITGNVFTGAPLDNVLTAHNDPRTGKQCRDAGARLALHTLVSTNPLTLTPSLACGACPLHGYIRQGHWVKA